jgi:hypothetical protein
MTSISAQEAGKSKGCMESGDKYKQIHVLEMFVRKENNKISPTTSTNMAAHCLATVFTILSASTCMQNAMSEGRSCTCKLKVYEIITHL